MTWLRLRPHARVVAGDSIGIWLPTADRPELKVDLPEGGLQAGWHWLSFDGDTDAGGLDAALLAPDHGDGFRESDRIPLGSLSARNTTRVEGVVLLRRATCGLRLDPCLRAHRIRVERFDIRPLGRSRVLARLLWRAPGERWLAWGQRLVAALRRLRVAGPRASVETLYQRYAGIGVPETVNYRAWLRLHDRVAVRALVPQAALPRISILLPVYESNMADLRACIDSVFAQTHSDWQLCIADDASPSSAVRGLIKEMAQLDSRVVAVMRDTNGHISEASNSALALADGEFIALLDHDDLLHPEALAELAMAAHDRPDWDLVYTDEDKVDTAGHRFDPYFKPDFNLDLLRSQNCISHLAIYRTRIVRELGGFRRGFEGSQDWDLALRYVDHVGARRVGHVARVLYHWRASPRSTAYRHDAKPYAADAALAAIGEHLARSAPGATVEAIAAQPGNYRVRHPTPDPLPLVSVVVPSRDQPAYLQRCIDSLQRTAGDLPLDIILVDNGSSTAAAHACFETLASGGARVLRDARPFNYAALNNMAVAHAHGDVLLLLNDDIEALSEGWLREMVSHALRPDVGAVGAKLFYPDGTLQHVGVVLGGREVAAHPFRGAPGGTPGQMNRNFLAQDYSAVTAACLALRRDVFVGVGGFDERLAITFNDVDLCLRIRESGLRVVWTPFAELVHHESLTRGVMRSPEHTRQVEWEKTWFEDRWTSWLHADPAYNPNLAFAPNWFQPGWPRRPPA